MADSWSNSEAYERYVGRWSSMVGARFLEWLEPQPGRRWLDVGCGTGALGEQIQSTLSPSGLIGVEPSESFLATANSRVRGPAVEFRVGSAEHIPVDDGAVDYVVSGLVLNFVPDKQAAMREMFRVLAPGGVAACYVWDYAGHVQFMRYFWDAAVKLNPNAREKDEGERFPICQPAPLRGLFDGAGFQSVEVQAIDIPTAFNDFDDFWTPFLSDIAPAPGYCASLPQAERNALAEAVRETVPTDSNGRILMAARAWAVSGVRP